jgi:heat shock protein HslJ
MHGGHWLLQSFITVGTLDLAPTGMSAGIHVEGADQISEDTGCNTGSATVTFATDATFTIGPLVMTKKPCADQRTCVPSWRVTSFSDGATLARSAAASASL